jgi:hypothetical protein
MWEARRCSMRQLGRHSNCRLGSNWSDPLIECGVSGHCEGVGPSETKEDIPSSLRNRDVEEKMGKW